MVLLGSTRQGDRWQVTVGRCFAGSVKYFIFFKHRPKRFTKIILDTYIVKLRSRCCETCFTGKMLIIRHDFSSDHRPNLTTLTAGLELQIPRRPAAILNTPKATFDAGGRLATPAPCYRLTPHEPSGPFDACGGPAKSVLHYFQRCWTRRLTMLQATLTATCFILFMDKRGKASSSVRLRINQRLHSSSVPPSCRRIPTNMGGSVTTEEVRAKLERGTCEDV